MAQSNNLDAELNAILEQFTKEEKAKINKIYKSVAAAAVRDLKSRSPRKRGEYQKGWRSKQEMGGIASDKLSITIYNATKPSLTHLLEKGHVIRNQSGSYGRAKAIPHIAKIEEQYNRELVRRLEAEL